MRTRMYGGVGGRKTKVGGKPTFVFLLLDYLELLLQVHVDELVESLDALASCECVWLCVHTVVNETVNC